MAEQIRSHPSLIFYDVANESQYNEWIFAAAAALRELDATRPIYATWATAQTARARREGNPGAPDVWDYHYQDENTRARIKEAGNLGVPSIFSEFAFTGAEGHDWRPLLQLGWEQIYRNDGAIGGAFWKASENYFYAPDPQWWMPLNSEIPTSKFMDGWRRPKELYWHVKAVYSPVQIEPLSLPVPAANAPIRVPVENRYDFANLSEVGINWSLGDEKGTLKAELAPHSKGALEIRSQTRDLNGQTLRLSFTDPRGIVVNSFALPIGTPAPEMVPGTAAGGAWKVETKPDAITVSNGRASWNFDRKRGQIEGVVLDGQTVLTGGPHIVTVESVTRNDVVKGRRGNQRNSFAASPNWKANSVEVATENGAPVLQINGTNADGAVTYRFAFGANGNVDLGYKFSYDKPFVAQRVGVLLDFAPAMDNLSWRLRPHWNDDMGAPFMERRVGVAAARLDWDKFQRTMPWGEKVGTTLPFHLGPNNAAASGGEQRTSDADATTRDFSAERREVASLSLANSQGLGLRIGRASGPMRAVEMERFHEWQRGGPAPLHRMMIANIEANHLDVLAQKSASLDETAKKIGYELPSHLRADAHRAFEAGQSVQDNLLLQLVRGAARAAER